MRIVGFVFFVSISFFSFIQDCIGGSQGPLTCATGAEDSSFGTTAWTNPSNITASDNSYATLNSQPATNTRYLKATNCGFSVPNGAVVTGILVEFERQAICAAGCTRDSRIRIVKGGVIGSTDRSAAALWPFAGVDEFSAFGSSTDLWGETWSPSDINDSGFGVVLSAIGESSGASSRVDSVRITVSYTNSSWFDDGDFF